MRVARTCCNKFLGETNCYFSEPKYRSVPQIRPHFCNLSLSTKRRGGLYAGCDNFSRDYALPSGHCRWGVGAKCGASPSARQRDAHDASGRLTSFSVEEQGSRALL